jgi:hypothetical protein
LPGKGLEILLLRSSWSVVLFSGSATWVCGKCENYGVVCGLTVPSRRL